MSISKPRILIGTSEEAVFRSVEILVSQHLAARGGAEIVRATRCDKCVRMAAVGDFDLAILAVNTLPQGGVFQNDVLDNAIQVIRTIKAGGLTSIVALTSMSSWPAKLLAAGADACLEMPFQVTDLAAAVDRCLESNAKERAEAAAKPKPPPEVPVVPVLWMPPEPGQRVRRKNDPLNPAPVRIVVVDDEQGPVETLRMIILSKYDVDLKSFTSSVAAWQELERSDPDLLITGYRMAEMDGKDIVCRLVARKVSYPILVMDAFLSEDVLLRSFPGAPNISILEMPFTVEQVFAQVEKHFEPVPAGA